MSLSIANPSTSRMLERQLGTTVQSLATSLQRLSTGLRVNGARDDAAGLAISQRFAAQVRGSAMAGRNANDGISLAQTAEGALAAVNENLQRMRELAVQSANATPSAGDRSALQREVAQRRSEIDRVATQTAFNGANLLDGSFAAKAFQVGADAGQTVSFDAIASMRSGTLGTYRGFHVYQPAQLIAGYPPQPYSVSVGGGPPVSFGLVGVDCKLEADAVNQAHIPGLTATVYENVAPAGVSAASATGSGSATLQLNGVSIALAGVPGAGSLAGNRATAIVAINAQASLTGVLASDNGSGVVFAAADGRNITASYAAGSFSGSDASDFGLWAVPGVYATAALAHDYVAPPEVSGSLDFVNGPWTLSAPIGPMGTPVDALDISTPAGAVAAMGSLDHALASVAAQRAALGAVQNRFASIEDNLRGSGNDLAAANGRILDADYARETAALSRGRILQQAGMAMLAQANVQAQGVLALLGAD